jgi:hypothetical protein
MSCSKCWPAWTWCDTLLRCIIFSGRGVRSRFQTKSDAFSTRVSRSGRPTGADALDFHAAPTIVIHLADLKIEKAAVEGERRTVEAGPVRYLATLPGQADEVVLR